MVVNHFAVNTVIPELIHKLAEVIIYPHTCYQISDVLTEMQQMVWQGPEHLGPLVINTGAPLGLTLSPVLIIKHAQTTLMPATSTSSCLKGAVISLPPTSRWTMGRRKE